MKEITQTEDGGGKEVNKKRLLLGGGAFLEGTPS